MSVFRGAEERAICLSPQENQPNVDLVENKTGPAFLPAGSCKNNPAYFLEIVMEEVLRRRGWQPESLHRVASRMVRIDMHINADGVIRYNRERLRGCANEPGFAPLHIQNVIARRQRNAIVSILVRRNLRDFFFVTSAQDDEWI